MNGHFVGIRVDLHRGVLVDFEHLQIDVAPAQLEPGIA
jgi:hypothetical protein